MAKISQDQLKEILIYDSNTGIFKWKNSPKDSLKPRRIAGCINDNTSGKRYIRIKISGQAYTAHHLAWLWVNGLSRVRHNYHDGRMKGRQLTVCNVNW